MKTEMRTRLAEVLKEHKEMNDFASNHWNKVASMETERRQLLLQIIKEEKLLSEVTFSFRIDVYIHNRTCVLDGPMMREMKGLQQLLKDTPEDHGDYLSLDLGDGNLSVNDGEVRISINKLKDVQKIIDDWSLKVEFKNLTTHKEKLVEDLKVVNNFIRKVTKKGGLLK
jgi:hypothetical protein